MPHIIAKRSDIPDGTLQLVELWPNPSKRLDPIDPPSQAKYLRKPQNDAVITRTVGIVTTIGNNPSGLAAWFGTNVDNGTPIQAEATITVGVPLAGDTITIGGVALTGIAGARTPGLDDFNVGAAVVADEIAAAINDALNSFTAIATAASATPVVTLTAVPVGAAGNTVTLATSNPAQLVLSGATLSGGSDGSSLTAAQMAANATAVLGLVGYGSLTTAPGAVTVATVNGVITGTITTNQLSNLLDILSGREYVVPPGVTIDTAGVFGVSPAVGATGGPGFRPGTYRRTVDTGWLKVSVGKGRLSEYKSTGFQYKGVGGTQGMAVVILNDNGTLYTP